MDEKTKDLIDQLIRYAWCVKLLEASSLTKIQHDALWELKQKAKQTLEQLINHLNDLKTKEES